MTNQVQNSNKTKIYDLVERTALFGESVIKFVKTLPHSSVNSPLVSQLVRASTSIGANYMEADVAESKKDFLHKIGICKKEAKESLHWLRMVAAANPDRTKDCRMLWKEAHELVLIFSAITRKK